MFVLNNYNQPQKDGHFKAYNATEIEHITKLYGRLLQKKDNVIKVFQDKKK